MTGVKKTIEELIKLYKNIMIFLKEANVELILFYGSLLGYYRNLEFINEDDDIDIIICRKDYDILKTYINSNIHKYPEIKIGINNNSILQLFSDNVGPFDIYAFDNYNDDILIRWDGNLLFDTKDIFPIKTITFHDYNISIPSNTENILFQTYGKNWKIPQKKYNYNWRLINTVKKL